MKWQLAPVFLPGEFHGQRSLAGYSPWGCRESDMTEHAPYRHFVRIMCINTSGWSKTSCSALLHLGWTPKKWWLWLTRMVTYIKVETQGNSVSDSIPSVHTLLNHLINAGLISTQACRVSDFLNRQFAVPLFYFFPIFPFSYLDKALSLRESKPGLRFSFIFSKERLE